MLALNAKKKGEFSFPDRYMIDISKKDWGGEERVRLTSDNNGEVLNSLEKAVNLLIEIRQKIKKNEFAPDHYQKKDYSKLVFEQYTKNWLQQKKAAVERDELALSTYDNIRTISTKHLIPAFIGKDIRKFRKDDIKKFYSKLTNMSGHYRQSIMKKLKELFHSALDGGLITYDQMPQFPKLKEVMTQKKWCSEKVQEDLIQYIPEQHRPIFFFIMHTGCRTGEAMALHGKDINIESREVTICRTFSKGGLYYRTKTKLHRTIPLDDEIYNILLKERKDISFVFLNPKTGGHYTKYTIGRIWNKALDSAGFEYIKLREWGRHSFITQAISRGCDIYDVMKWVGHTKLSTTEGYTHSLGDRLKEVMRPAKIVDLSSGKKKVVIDASLDKKDT